MTRRLLLPLIAIGLSVMASEALLQAAGWLSPWVRYQIDPPWSRDILPDDRLGFRLSPQRPGLDRRGFPNRPLLDDYDVVALGDSMTFGFGASPEQSWPAYFGQLSERPTYRAAVGGYGPCEYGQVFEDVRALAPDLVVLALYLGNDLGDAYTSVYEDGRCDEWRTDDAAVLSAMTQADAVATLRDRLEQFSQDVPQESGHLLSRSALYGLARAIRHQWAARVGTPAESGDALASASSNQFRLVMHQPEAYRTAFRLPDRDILALDLEDPRIMEGLRVTLRVVDSLAERTAADGAPLLVAILHSKPYALAPALEQDTGLWPKFSRLVDSESLVTDAILEHLAAAGIPHVDTGPKLREAVAGGLMPYPASEEDHPMAVGYEVIADAIWDEARRLRW